MARSWSGASSLSLLIGSGSSFMMAVSVCGTVSSRKASSGDMYCTVPRSVPCRVAFVIVAISGSVFLTTPQGQAHLLFRNKVGQENNWLRIALEGGPAVGRDAFGSVVRLHTSAGTLTSRPASACREQPSCHAR